MQFNAHLPSIRQKRNSSALYQSLPDVRRLRKQRADNCLPPRMRNAIRRTRRRRLVLRMWYPSPNSLLFLQETSNQSRNWTRSLRQVRNRWGHGPPWLANLPGLFPRQLRQSVPGNKASLRIKNSSNYALPRIWVKPIKFGVAFSTTVLVPLCFLAWHQPQFVGLQQIASFARVSVYAWTWSGTSPVPESCSVLNSVAITTIADKETRGSSSWYRQQLQNS